jgi:CheY-like chemotaxis protein
MAETSPLPLAGLRVLLAEDQPVTRELFSSALTCLGAEVRAVANGVQAVAVCLAAEEAGRPFHVALLDYRMPESDGAETALILRTSRYSGEVLGLTAGIDSDEARRWRESGCSVMLPKSLGPREVARRLAAYVGFGDAQSGAAAG